MSCFLFLLLIQGYNDNPTAQQFEAAYRKLLVHNDVLCSEKSNCLDSGTKILSVSSNRRKKVKASNQKDTSELTKVQAGNDDYWLNQNLLYVADVHNHSIACMASVLESRIIRARQNKIIKCGQCISAFIENEIIDDSFIRFKSKNSEMLQPCKSTFEICKFVDTYLKTYDGANIPYATVLLEILRKISFANLFVRTNFENHGSSSGQLAGHRYDFVKKIVEFYMRMKSVETAKKLTLDAHDNSMRHTYKKLIQQLGE